MNPLFKPKLSEVLFTDTETWSTVDLKACGTVKYCEAADMLLGGFLLGDKYGVYDFSDDDYIIPQWVIDHANQGGWFCAHNALFDYIILKKHIPYLDISQFIDTMGWCGAAGIPMSLAKAGFHLEIPEDAQKVKEGTRLVRKFCIPRKPSKYNKATRSYPRDDPNVSSVRGQRHPSIGKEVESGCAKPGIPRC
jgi:DNA polymerase